MSARNIVRTATNLIIAQIQNNIAASLTDVHVDEGDNIVSTQIPLLESYFYYNAQVYRAPGVFVIPQSVDFKLSRGQNFLCATASYLISIVIEERKASLMNLKAWQYQDALHECLHGIELVSGKVKIVILVNRARFSADSSDKSDGADVFRKEVAFDCDVEIYEQL
jgi:hypothetical protein